MSDLADLTTHRIEGIARMGKTPFSVALFSHIEGNLWTGGCPVEKAPAEFKFIVNLYPWGQYSIAEHQIITIARLFDGEEVPDPALLGVLADHVNACRSVGKTLVHCQAGLNRSALVAAYALIRAGGEPAAAIKKLRDARSPAVLCNSSFENWLLAGGA